MRVSTSWHDHAACRDADPDIFFPIGESGPALDQIDEAKRICRTCPAQAPCLAWALEHQITDGIWGSNTAEERHVIRKIPRQMKTCPLHGGVDMAVAAAALGHLRGWPFRRALSTARRAPDQNQAPSGPRPGVIRPKAARPLSNKMDASNENLATHTERKKKVINRE